jgi:hypothetical protein
LTSAYLFFKHAAVAFAPASFAAIGKSVRPRGDDGALSQDILRAFKRLARSGCPLLVSRNQDN